jgi:hypothetical protein
MKPISISPTQEIEETYISTFFTSSVALPPFQLLHIINDTTLTTMVERLSLQEEATCGSLSQQSMQSQINDRFQRLKECCRFRFNFKGWGQQHQQHRFILPAFVHNANKLLVGWFLGAAVSIFLPLIIFGAARIQLRKQQEYDEQGNAQGDGEQGYNQCRWWQWGCNTNYEEDEHRQENNEDEPSTPWWWFFADEETRRRREESRSNNPALVFAYVWSLAMFCAILFFGYREIRNGSDLYRVVSCLAVFANFSFLTVFLIGGMEGVETGGRELEEQGFYSQFPVLMLLSNFCWTLFAGIFAIVFYLEARKSGVTKIDFDTSDYMIHDTDPHLLQNKSYVHDKEPVSA